MLTATYIINRLLSGSIKNKTQYEILLGQKPSYDHMRLFGCLVYVKENKQGREKFEERGRPCVFIGYPQRQKVYKVFDIQENKILVSRDVKFVECKFPYHAQTNTKSHDDSLKDSASFEFDHEDVEPNPQVRPVIPAGEES